MGFLCFFFVCLFFYTDSNICMQGERFQHRLACNAHIPCFAEDRPRGRPGSYFMLGSTLAQNIISYPYTGLLNCS